VGEWRLNNAATDTSGSGNNGTANGTAYNTTSPYEGTHSLLFDATGDSFSVLTALWNANTGTILLSARATAFRSGAQYLFTCYYNLTKATAAALPV
jgi:hypothetical protein